jgi:hypothetical protein
VNNGGFAGSVGTDQACDFSAPDHERDLVERGEGAVGFRQPIDGNEHRDTVREQIIQNKRFAARAYSPALSASQKGS